MRTIERAAATMARRRPTATITRNRQRMRP
jgi:hypothetical protein